MNTTGAYEKTKGAYDGYTWKKLLPIFLLEEDHVTVSSGSGSGSTGSGSVVEGPGLAEVAFGLLRSWFGSSFRWTELFFKLLSK